MSAPNEARPTLEEPAPAAIADLRARVVGVKANTELARRARCCPARWQGLSSWLAEVAAAKPRAEALEQHLGEWQCEHGAFTPAELGAGRAGVRTVVGRSGGVSALVLDAGALVATEHDDRALVARLRVAQRHGGSCEENYGRGGGGGLCCGPPTLSRTYDRPGNLHEIQHTASDGSGDRRV